MLIDSQKVIDIVEKYKGYGINGILENIVEDIDNLCLEMTDDMLMPNRSPSRNDEGR